MRNPPTMITVTVDELDALRARVAALETEYERLRDTLKDCLSSENCEDCCTIMRAALEGRDSERA